MNLGEWSEHLEKACGYSAPYQQGFALFLPFLLNHEHTKKTLLMSDSELRRQGLRLYILTFAGECCALKVVFDRGYCSSELSSEHTHGKHGREGNRLKTLLIP